MAKSKNLDSTKAIELFLLPNEADKTPSDPVSLWNTLPALAPAPRRIPGSKIREAAEASDLLNRAMRDAEIVRARAIEQAGEIIEEAKGVAENLRNDAIFRGYNIGLEKARQEVRAELEVTFRERVSEMQKAVDELIESICTEREVTWNAMEKEITELGIQIARKVIKIELERDPHIVKAVVMDALRRVTDRSSLRILVNPSELAYARNCREDFMSLIEGVKSLEIDAERRVGKGGCVIETNAGTIDAKLDTQLEQIIQALK